MELTSDPGSSRSAEREARLARWLAGLVLVNLVVGALLLGRTLLQPSGAPSAGDPVAFVDGRVKALDLTPQERQWEQIGWTYDLDEAMRLSRKHGRPMLIYCLNGQLDGRC